MRKSLLIVLILCVFSIAPAFAQNNSRVFDNFDTKRGVQVIKPPVAPPERLPQESKDKKLVKKTSQTMSASEGYGVRTSSNYKKISMASRKHMGKFSTGDEKVDSYILESCQRYNIDPLLIYSQMHQESAFKKQARSYKGASGLMQLMPATARRFGVTKIYDPKQNIEGGVRYMRWLLDKFNGDVVLALAGYNAGEGAVMKYGWRVPPYRETQEYVRRIATRYMTIGNPNLINNSRTITETEAAKLDEKDSEPLTVYEPNILTVRLPDGSMRLLKQ